MAEYPNVEICNPKEIRSQKPESIDSGLLNALLGLQYSGSLVASDLGFRNSFLQRHITADNPFQMSMLGAEQQGAVVI